MSEPRAATPRGICASRRATLIATLSALGLLLVLLFRGALFDGDVFSQADFLLEHEPWRAVAPPDFVPGNPELADQTTQFQPWALLLRESLARGDLPLWNARAGAGQPLLANLQSAVLSPFTALSLLFPFGAGLLAAALAQLLCAGLGTALLARRLGASLPACVLAALAFSLGGFQFLWLGHPHAAVSCLLPWLLLLADIWTAATLAERARRAPEVDDAPASPSVQRDAPRWLRPAFALCVAALILCGHIETALHVALTVAAYVLLASGGRPAASRARLLLDVLCWSLVGVLISGVQLLPFLEYLHLSEAYAKRSGFQDLWRRVPWEQTWPLLRALALQAVVIFAVRRAWRALGATRGATSHADRPAAGATPAGVAVAERSLVRATAWSALALALGALVLSRLDEAGFSPLHRLLFHPDAYGHPVPSRDMPFNGPRTYVNINNGYAGLLCLALALFAMVCGPRGHRGVRTFTWLWLAAFALAYELPVVSQLVNRLPLLNLSLNYRLTLVVGFASALLAAFGLDALCRPATRGRAAGAFWVTALVIAAALAIAPNMDRAPRWDFDVRQTPDGKDERVPLGTLSLVSDPVYAGQQLVIDGSAPVPVPDPVADPVADPAPVPGAAESDTVALEFVIELEQDGVRRTERVQGVRAQAIAGDAVPTAATDVAAPRATLHAELDLAEFQRGLVRVSVRLAPDDRLLWEQDVRFVAPSRVAARWWLLGAGSLLLMWWGTRRGMPGAAPGGATGAAHASPATKAVHASPANKATHASPATKATHATLLPFAALALLGTDLYLFARGVHPSAPPERFFPATPVTDFLLAQPQGGRVWALEQVVLMPNTAGVYGLADLRAYDALGVERMAWLREALRPPAPGEDVDVTHPLFDALDVRFVLAPSAWVPPTQVQFTRAFAAGGLVVWRNDRARGRAFVTGEARAIDAYLELRTEADVPDNSTYAGLSLSAARRRRALEVARKVGFESAHDPWRARHELLIEGDAPRAALDAASGAFDGPPAGFDVEWLRDEPQRQELLVTAAAPGWLCVADAFFPGWQATVNAVPAEIVPAFFALRAVRVPAGESRVVFSYEPASVRLGGWLSAAGGLLLLAGVVVSVRRSRRAREGQEREAPEGPR